MRDLREFHDPRLHLPIAGHDIVINSPTADQGLRIKRHMYSGESTPQDEMRMIAEIFGADYDEESDTMSGGKWDELNELGLSLHEIIHVGNTALAHFGVGTEFGEYWWENRLGKEGEPLIPEATAAVETETPEAPTPASMPKKTENPTRS
ncbi:DUF7426 family protein [Corynebacterium kalidii]